MRLLHIKNLQFKEFFDSEIPPYVILSHRWDEGSEISLQEFESSEDKAGHRFTKIIKACSIAQQEEKEICWIWIDTCCIDQKSSAEVSYAINSMYRWYNEAKLCIVFLADVLWNGNESGNVQRFEKSNWFTRGWTLQELLAPSRVHFFDRNWNMVGTKQTLSAAITSATKIAPHRLTNPTTACIAAKMSWLSKRETSRIEDMAYCMLGLFGVNMPLLYGEGRKAFMRLQLEIIRKTDDESIFAWTENTTSSSWEPRGMLAVWPTAFTDSYDVESVNLRWKSDIVKAYAMTNKGLKIRVPRSLIVPQDEMGDCMTLSLGCFKGQLPLAITLWLDHGSQQWYRMNYNEWQSDIPKYDGILETQTAYIYQDGL